MEIGWSCCAGCGRRAPNYHCNSSSSWESHSARSTSLAWCASELRLISGSTTTSCVYSFWRPSKWSGKGSSVAWGPLKWRWKSSSACSTSSRWRAPNRDDAVSLQVVVVPLKVDAWGKLTSKMPPCSSNLISPPGELLGSQILKGPEIGVIVALNVGWLSAPEGAVEQNSWPSCSSCVGRHTLPAEQVRTQVNWVSPNAKY